MGYLEKWLCKRPPTDPQAEQQECVNEEAQVDPLVGAQNEAENIPLEDLIQPQGDVIPETSQARAIGSALEAEGAGVS